MTQSQHLMTEKYSDLNITLFMEYYNDIKSTISKDLKPLFKKLGLRDIVADTKFKVILTKGIIGGHFSHGDGLDLLSMLLDDNYLIPGNIFNSNYDEDWSNLLNPQIWNNKTFQSLKNDILDHNGKGVGKGEYFLLLFVKGYKIKTGNSDGSIDIITNEGLMVEATLSNQVKDASGGSMKPCSDSSRRVIDDLNKSYFNNTAPFSNEWSDDIKRISDLKSTLITYFSKLHDSWDINNDITPMVNELISTNGDLELMRTIYGIKVLKKYKEVDNFDCITLISKEKILIIRDFDNIPLDKVTFNPIMKRGGDSQALADGYVNIKLK